MSRGWTGRKWEVYSAPLLQLVSIDPLTGAHLTKDMLEPCKELKRRLEKWHLEQAMQKGAAADADADNAF